MGHLRPPFAGGVIIFLSLCVNPLPQLTLQWLQSDQLLTTHLIGVVVDFAEVCIGTIPLAISTMTHYRLINRVKEIVIV